MVNKTTTLTLTASELDIIYYALNSYGLKMSNKSKTYGNTDAFIANGWKGDWYEERALETARLECRIGDAQDRLEERARQLNNAVEEIIAGRA